MARRQSLIHFPLHRDMRTERLLSVRYVVTSVLKSDFGELFRRSVHSSKLRANKG